jgi:mRNA-degrading endonuclease RelE of RelBE toxin-antitoxin system
MAIVVLPTNDFIKELKRIAKKQKGVLSDIAKLSALLKENPTMGTELAHNFYKIRMAISGSNKGKSGGARIITYFILDQETVLLTEIYLKSENDTADVSILIQRLKDQGLI